MTVTILDGSPTEETGITPRLLEGFQEKAGAAHRVNYFSLASMDLRFCTGCWSCWWKTPGICAIKDDGEQIFRTVINSDFLIFASPLSAGFTSSLLKKVTDRLIVLLHPYIEIRNRECHHKKRYDSYPEIGLIFKEEADTDGQDIEILRNIYKRFALNFHSRLKYALPAGRTSIEEIVNETCGI